MPQATKSAFSFMSDISIVSYICGSIQSSLSTNATKSPVATARPAFRASESPPFFFMDYFNAFVFFRPIFTHLSTVIRRTVIHQDNLQILISLIHNRLNTLIQKFFHLINWNNNGYHIIFFFHLYYIYNTPSCATQAKVKLTLPPIVDV